MLKRRDKIMKKQRLDYLDFAKCIAILLVIWGHASPTGSSPMYRVVLYSFHMPLFFLVSGMVISRHQHGYDKEHWKNFIFKNIMTLLVPYLIWGAIYSSFTYANFFKLFYGSWEILGSVKTLTSLWFLPCLFVSRILAELMLMLSWKVNKIPRHLFAFFVSIAAFIIGFLLPHISIGYPLCFNISFVALGFIMMGYAIKDIILKISKINAWIYLAAAAVFTFIFLMVQFLQKDSPYLMHMCSGDYGNPFLFFLNSFAGIGAVMSFSIFLTFIFRNDHKEKAGRFMLWAGKNTIGIYLIHKPFLQEIVMPIISGTLAFLPVALQGLIGAAFTFIYSAVVCYVINKFVPSLFGKFPNLK